MLRHTRYQGAIIRDHHILLLLHREHDGGRGYWIIPGGGMEEGESEAFAQDVEEGELLQCRAQNWDDPKIFCVNEVGHAGRHAYRRIARMH